MNYKSGTDRPRRKGILILGFLILTVVLAAGTLIAVVGSGSAGSIPTASRDPLGAAKILYADGDFAGAEALLRSLMTTDPGDTRVKILLGRVLVERGRLREAQGLFNAVQKEKPEEISALLGLATFALALRAFIAPRGYAARC